MRLPFTKKKPEFSPLERVENAIDELNLAMVELRKDEDLRHLRPWVRSGDLRTKQKPKVMLGYWSPEDQCFITVYGED